MGVDQLSAAFLDAASFLPIWALATPAPSWPQEVAAVRTLQQVWE